MNAPHYFITGTDTEVGKTLISAMILHRLRALGHTAVGMKPIAAGCETRNGERWNEDVAILRAASDIAPPELINPYLFDEPIAPHIAAARSGVCIDESHIIDCYRRLAANFDAVIVEGAGGFRVPLGDDFDTAQLAAKLRLPVILVVGMRLGCINHTLLTAEAIAARGLVLAGWVANRIDPAMLRFEDNLATLTQRLSAPLLGVVPHTPHPDPAKLASVMTGVV